MVTSNVALTADGRSSRVALRDAGVNLVRLFGPEHGLGGIAEDGAAVSDDTDPQTGLPAVSLYGQSVRPRPESLADLDALIYDIPDVGARFYTYIWTLSHLLEAAADANKPVYVLDRPNPIGGSLDVVEGPILDEKLASFVGRWNIPVRYSLTIGELAQLWNKDRNLNCDLTIIPCANWHRSQHWPELGLPFMRLSPAMISYETALLYPGTCLIEGTKLSEGRGTDAPFRLIGAPWVDADELASSLNARRLPGLNFSPATFTPEGRKYAGELCKGVRIEVTEAKAARPVAAGLHLVADLIRLHPDRFEWLPYPTAASGEGLQHFGRLIGRSDVRELLTRGSCEINPITAADGWKERVTPHLIYPA